MVNSYQCIPMSETIKIKSRKHKCGYRMKTIDYNRHEYVITCNELTPDITDSIHGTHTAKNDTIGIKWDVPYVEQGSYKKHDLIVNVAAFIIAQALLFAVLYGLFILLDAIWGM